jgi:hypothetical protein
MSWQSFIIGAFLAIGVISTHLPQEANAQASAGWVTLFDGKNLASFNTVGDANWRIEDGAVVADKGTGFGPVAISGVGRRMGGADPSFTLY